MVSTINGINAEIAKCVNVLGNPKVPQEKKIEVLEMMHKLEQLKDGINPAADAVNQKYNPVSDQICLGRATSSAQNKPKLAGYYQSPNYPMYGKNSKGVNRGSYDYIKGVLSELDTAQAETKVRTLDDMLNAKDTTIEQKRILSAMLVDAKNDLSALG